MMAFEADVYHISDEDRITVLPQGLAVEDYPDLDVPQLKFFMYYAPDADPALNARKQDIVADLGTRCRAAGVRFLMEPLVYHPTLEPGTADYAAHKPDMVRRATQVFAGRAHQQNQGARPRRKGDGDNCDEIGHRVRMKHHQSFLRLN